MTALTTEQQDAQIAWNLQLFLRDMREVLEGHFRITTGHIQTFSDMEALILKLDGLSLEQYVESESEELISNARDDSYDDGYEAGEAMGKDEGYKDAIDDAQQSLTGLLRSI